MAVNTKSTTAKEQKKGIMQVQRQFEDKQLVQKIESMPIDELRKSLGLETKNNSEPSQADLILQDVQNPKYSLNGVEEDVMKSVKEFRDNFHFEHDK